MQLILSKIRIYIQCYMLLDIIYCSSESCLHNSEGIGSVCSDSSRFFAAGQGQIYPSGQRHGWKIAWSAHPDEILKSGTRPGAIRTKLGSWCPDKNLIFGIKAFCNNPGSCWHVRMFDGMSIYGSYPCKEGCRTAAIEWNLQRNCKNRQLCFLSCVVEDFTLPHLFQLESTGVQVESWSPDGLHMSISWLGALPNWCVDSIWTPYGVHMDQVESMESTYLLERNVILIIFGWTPCGLHWTLPHMFWSVHSAFIDQ